MLIYTNYIQGQKNTTLDSVVNEKHPREPDLTNTENPVPSTYSEQSASEWFEDSRNFNQLGGLCFGLSIGNSVECSV